MEGSGKCEICGINKSKYSCPKCQVLYCSVLCYQSQHHLQCSEIFYEQWMQEELKKTLSDSESKRKMLEILRENQETSSEENLDSDDEDAVPDLVDRLIDVNLDDEEAVWSKLTTEERKEFRKLVATGKIITILPEWEPWWKIKKKKILVEDVEKNLDWISKIPAVPYQILKLQELTKIKPSPYVPFMLLNILISYVYTVRWLKGTHKVLSLEGISTCIALSVTLKSNGVVKSPVEAFEAFGKSLLECKWIDGVYNRDQMQEDLEDIMKKSDESGSFFFIKAVICDLNFMCLQALDILKEDKSNHLKRFSGPPPTVHFLQQISRKLNYYLSWVAEHGSSLINEV